MLLRSDSCHRSYRKQTFAPESRAVTAVGCMMRVWCLVVTSAPGRVEPLAGATAVLSATDSSTRCVQLRVPKPDAAKSKSGP